MKKFLIVIVLLALALAFVTAADQTATVKSFAGKVEFRTGTGAWTAVTAGVKLPIGATVSTGFDSRAVLEIGNSTLNVSPLTRMTIRELVEKNGVVSTDLYLQVGKVKTEVKKTQGVQNDFTIRSPVTTASVRGTVFDFDTVNLAVSEGVVLYTDIYLQSMRIGRGESAAPGDGGPISGGGAKRDSDLLVSWNTSDVNGPQMGGLTTGTGSAETVIEMGSVTVRWYYLIEGGV